MNTVDKTILHHTKGRSAEYQVEIVQHAANLFEVITRWGKIGRGLQSKVETASSLSEARRIADQHVAGKQARGYSVVMNAPAPPISAPPAQTRATTQQRSTAAERKPSRTEVTTLKLPDLPTREVASPWAEGEIVEDDVF